VEQEVNPTPQPALAGAVRSGGITERERQILSWLREGMSNNEVGVVLGISALTVKNHVQKILRKLNAANRAQAVARAMSMNLLDPAPAEKIRAELS
jgi:DNA-binding CsgD family transcriptional regulator